MKNLSQNSVILLLWSFTQRIETQTILQEEHHKKCWKMTEQLPHKMDHSKPKIIHVLG